MSKGLNGIKASLFCMVLAVVVNGLFLSLPANAQDMEELFDEGVNLYKRGHLEEALQAFQSVLAENPSHEMAFEFWNKAGHQIFLQMLLERGEYESVAKRFIELARVGRKEKEEDGQRIEELVRQVVEGDQRDRTEALLKLMADHGEYAVEYMYRELANEDIEARVNVMTGLARMGQEIVLPLVQVMNSQEVMIRRNAAAVLGNLGDTRAVPALKRMAEGDDDDLNCDVAIESVLKITGRDPSELGATATLYIDLAKGYLNRDDTVLKPYQNSRVVWRWQEDQLTKTPVFKDLYALELAKDACYEALKIEPGSREAPSLLAFIYAASKAITNAIRMSLGNDEDLMPEGLVSAAVNLAKSERLVSLTGPQSLDKALTFAVEGGHKLAAIELISVISKYRVKCDTLKQTLKDKNKLVRYFSALALASAGESSDEVISALVAALQESAVQHVLVIDDNSETRNALLHDLDEAGYFTVSASQGAVGLTRAKSFPLKDLVIMRSNVSELTIDKVVRGLSADELTSEIPIFLLVDEKDKERVHAVWGGKVAGFISSPPVKAVYLPLIEETLADALNPEREEAVAISAWAGEALTMVDSALLKSHIEALTGALDKNDDVKKPVLEIIARIGDPQALEPVKTVFGEESASVEVKIAAANALGAMFSNLQGPPDAEVLSLLADAFSSEDMELSSAAGAAIGKVKELPQGFMEKLLTDYRID